MFLIETDTALIAGSQLKSMIIFIINDGFSENSLQLKYGDYFPKTLHLRCVNGL